MTVRSDSADYHQTFDPEQEPIIERVAMILAAYKNQPVTEIPPLFRVIDPEAFARLLKSGATPASDAQVQIEFVYDDLTVVVSSSGDVWIFDSRSIVTERSTDE